MRVLALIVALWAVGAAAAPTDGAMASTPSVPPEMTAAIEHYRAIEARGGWPVVPATATVHPGERTPVVLPLRTRLEATGDLQPTAGTPLPPPPHDLYTGNLVAAVRAFQRRHGLAVDGVLGSHTLAALNVPARTRLAQLELAAERSRRRTDLAARRWVRVNIPAYRLELIEDGRPVLAMPVVVGRPDRATPELTSTITFLVLNPSWTIPTKLAYHDVLPKVRRDPDYLAEHGIAVYAGWRRDAERIDPEWIDWGLIGPGIKHLKLRQEPGPANPLGQIKFHMANAFDVYLHDTSSHDLMARANRALSSGCVRVGDARALATAVLAGNPDWNAERLDEVIASGETTKVYLRMPVPVQLYYQTAWVAEGRVQFREDIYHQDEAFAAEVAATATAAPEPLGRAVPPGLPDTVGRQ